MVRRALSVSLRLLPAVLLVTVYWIYVGFLKSDGTPVPQSYAQLHLFPFVVLYVFWLLRPVYKCSKVTIPAVIICGLLLTGFSDTILNWRSGVALFAPLKGDQLASKTRLVRSEYETVFGKRRLNKAKSIFDKITTHEAAVAELARYPRAVGVFWGDNKNLRVTLKAKASAYTPSKATWLRELRDYKIINEIPRISAGLEPLESTVKVIAAALVGSELDMLQATRVKARWRTTVARSYLFFKLANFYMADAVSGKAYQYGPLDCAINAYMTSLKLLRPVENPELYRAIMNNASVAFLMRGHAEQNKSDLKKSRQYILLATRSPKKKGVRFDSIDIARENMKYITSFNQQGGFKRNQ